MLNHGPPQTASSLLGEVGGLWGPPPDLVVSEWAAANRVLVSESSAEPGAWSNERAPYQSGIMDACCDDDTEEVTVMTSAQSGKSEALLNVVGYYVDQDPAPMLLLQPTLQMAEAFSKDRLAPMIRACPALAGKVADAGSKRGGNTLLHKQFPGGHVTLAGANSPASLASRPVRIVLGDERNKWGVSAGTEGDPWDLAKARAKTFHNRKFISTSTPGFTGVCPIERDFLSGDQRRFWVPCPHCGEYQVLRFANLKWEKDKPETAQFQCVGCEKLIDEGHRAAMLANGDWRAEQPFKGHASFHIWEAYSPWSSWASIAKSFLIAKKTPETLQVWTNSVAGETWEDRATSVDAITSSGRCEPYNAEVPAQALVLTAGVDVQDNRLEISVYGWGEHDTPWAIDHVVIAGNTGGKAVWTALDDLLFNREFDWECGGVLKIASACIDSGGHRTQEVYSYVEPRQIRRVYAIKGASGDGYPVIQAPQGRRLAESKIPVRLHLVGTDAGKSAVYHRLSLPADDPARAHFPNREPFDDVFFDGLTAEKCIIEYRMGRPKRVWKKKVSSARNEPLDCAVYALAAVHKLRPNYRTLMRRVESAAEKDSPAQVQKPKRSRKSGGSFATSWRK